MKRYRIHFSNSNNAWYTGDSFYGEEIEMLKYVNEKLNNKENKFYNLWIYDENNNRMYMDDTLGGCFHRGKKLEKLINSKQIQT
jgi:hypothetical protein